MRRTLGLRFMVALVLGALVGFGMVPRAYAATITVTTTADSGAGSLRQAIADANATAGADTITFQSGLAGTITLTSGQLVIAGDLTIQGPGAAVLTVSGNNAARVFFINPGAAGATTGPPATSPTVLITDLTVANGRGIGGAGSGGGGSGGGAAGMGGGLFVNGGNVTLARVVFANHQAIGGGSGQGGRGTGGSGGGGGGFGSDGSSARGGNGGALGGNGGVSGQTPNIAGGNGGDGGGGGGGDIPLPPTTPGGPGGDGGFGAGGGGGASTNGPAGPGGDGGFGGGGGGAAGAGISGVGGIAGRFGGAGGASGVFNDAAGGGGAGLGGAVFVRAGSTLLNQVSFSTNSTTGGIGGLNKEATARAASGQGKGGALFICTAAEDASCSATVRGSGVTFSGNSAPDDAGITTDSDDVYGTITPVTLTTPTVTINQGASQADPTDVSPIVFDVRFSESVTSFDGSDVLLSGTAGATTASISGSGSSYTVSVSGMATDGTVIASIPAGAALGASGNGNSASTSTDNTVTSVVNQAPVANNDSATTNEDTPVAIGVLGNDTDGDGDALTPSIVSGPSSGTATVNANGTITYTPNANFNGGDSFTYRVSDGALDSNVATVGITVASVNDAPVANNDSASTNEDTAVTISVLTNDSDVESSSLTPSIVSGPSNGQATVNANGTITYTPNANFNGGDSFTYTVSDGTATSNVATVSLTVNAVNDAPTIALQANVCAAPNTPTGSFRLTLSDVDSAATNLSLSATSSNTSLVPVNGITFSGSGANRIVTIVAATRSGTAVVTITVSDGQASTQHVITVKQGTGNNETITGTAGADLVFGQGGNDTVNGQDGVDLLCGGSGNDTLNGGEGDDALDGQNGDDRVNGEAGNDTLTGGASADRFDGGDGTDSITDFTPSVGDTRVNVP